MDTLPVELLHEIASHDQAAYRALLAIPLFARSLNPGVIVDYKIAFGFDIDIFLDQYRQGCTGWFWYNGYHRIDGPAFECENGDKEWWINGRRHREDGPAIEWWYGRTEWYRNGKLHREDGPAIEGPYITGEWWMNGIRIK